RPPDQEWDVGVSLILIVSEKSSDDRERIRGGQSFRRASKLAANLDGWLNRGAAGEQPGNGWRDLRFIAGEPHCPQPDDGVGMFECFQSSGFIELSHGVKGPEGLERDLAGILGA